MFEFIFPLPSRSVRTRRPANHAVKWTRFLLSFLAMNFFKTKVSVIYAIIPAIGWVLTFLFGTGVFWERTKIDLVNLEIAGRLGELYQKKAAALEELSRPEVVKGSADRVWQAKMDGLNAIEKRIAQVEGRKAVMYGRPNPVSVKMN